MGVVSPVPHVPWPGASTKHNGQPLAEPAEGVEETQRGVGRPMTTREYTCDGGGGGGGGQLGLRALR